MSMWKTRKDEEQLPPAPVTPHPPVKEIPPVVTPTDRKPFEPERADAPARSTGMAHIGKSVLIKGELSGSEDLYIDGEVEGTVDLRDNNLTVGPNGKVHANLQGREIVILGRVQGNVKARDKVEIRKSGSIVGDIVTARITIEDGGMVKGSIDIQKVVETAAPAASAAQQRQGAPATHQTQAAGEKRLP